MNIRSIIAYTSMVLIPVVLTGCGQAAEDGADGERPPNVVLLLTDDQGCGDVAFTGNDELATPHLDRLTEEGTHFTSFYVSPVCSPTRASLLTGRYHQRTGVRGVIEGREFMVEQEVTLAELLSDAGYATGIFGKWHLGENYPMVPQAQGFDTFIGFRDGSHPYFDVTLEYNGQPYPTEGYLTDVLTDHALTFMEDHRDEPFFLYLPYNAPHTPLEVPEEYVEPYDHLPRHTALIYGMMASVDENVGRVLRQIETLGLSENTLVLFLSDNGPLYAGDGYEEAPRFNCGLRGEKYSVYEGGMRVPFVARWPRVVPEDHTIDTLAAYIDLFPTVLDYADVSVPESLAIDGRSLRPLLEGEADAWRERTLFMSYPGERELREGDSSPYPGGMALDGRHKMVDGDELYDLAADEGEHENIAAERPGVLERLDAAYRAFWEEVTAERAPYPRVHVGHEEENPARLTAHWASLTGGPTFQFEDDPPRYRDIGVHGDWITRWSAEGQATWRLAVQADARYRVSALVRCSEGMNEVHMHVEAGEASIGRPLTACVENAGEWVEQELGAFSMSAEDAELSVKMPDAGDRVVLKHLLLERLDDV